MGGNETDHLIASIFDQFSVYFLRPIVAITFVFSLIALSWFVAWKTVLVHVPLVQEIFGLRKKKLKPRPSNVGRISRFYRSQSTSRSTKPDAEEK
ncbi:hypothetical protein LUZ60_004255 [Juncus effusus]|nr:hypothetical protein LUZ60_004255 [Juncus effusus]